MYLNSSQPCSGEIWQFGVNTLCLAKAVLSPQITALELQHQENYTFTVHSINQWTSPGVHPSSYIILYLLYFPPSLSLRASSWKKKQRFLQTPLLFEAELLSPPPPLDACHRQDWQLMMKYEQVISRHPSVCESPKTPWCGSGTDVLEDLLQLVTCPLPQAVSSASQHFLPQPPASERFFYTERWTCGLTPHQLHLWDYMRRTRDNTTQIHFIKQQGYHMLQEHMRYMIAIMII